MFAFQWHLTDRCNRRCKHCYQQGFGVSDAELTAEGRREAAARIFTAIPQEGVSLNLTGGEPLVLPDLFQLMQYVETFDNLSEIGIITNGTIDDRALLEKLASIKKFSTFLISVEADDPQVNDQIRGRGALEIVTRNMALYKAVTGRKITLMMTLSKLNLGHIVSTTEFARKHGADAIMFERFIPMGKGREMTEAVLAANQWRQAIASIGVASGMELEPDDVAACRAFLLDLSLPGGDPDALSAALCNLGPESMALMPDGQVYPCRRLGLSVGNLMEEPFSVIRGRLGQWECSQLRQRFTGDICGQCFQEDCPGCRALARVMGGDLFGDDPQCVYLGG